MAKARDQASVYHLQTVSAPPEEHTRVSPEEKLLAAAAQVAEVTERHAIFNPAALSETTDRDDAPILHPLCT